MRVFSNTRNVITGILAAVCFLGIYEWFAHHVGRPLLFPPLERVTLESLPSFATFAGSPRPELWPGCAVLISSAVETLRRVVVGGCAGVLLGFPAGLSMHYFRRSRAANDYLLAFLRAVPLFALIPLFVFWANNGEPAIYTYIAFGVAVVLATSTYEGVINVPSRYEISARLLGARRTQVFTTVYIPAIAPEVLAGIRSAIGWSWAFSLGAEYISATSGLGFLAYRSYLYSDMGKLFILAGIYVVLGWAGDVTVRSASILAAKCYRAGLFDRTSLGLWRRK